MPFPRRGPSKLFHGNMPLMADVRGAQHFFQSFAEDEEIQLQAPVFHVPDIELELFLPGESVSPVDLSPSGNSRQHFQAPPLPGVIEGNIFRKKRPGTHEAHLSPENVIELGNFVQAGTPEETAEGGKALFILQEVSRGIPGVSHGPELEKPKERSSLSRPFLREKDGPSHGATHPQGDKQKKRREKQQSRQSSDNIDGSFRALSEDGTARLHARHPSFLAKI